jgi:hypothetical protein
MSGTAVADPLHLRVRGVNEQRALFTVSEAEEGADLDGDGDALDDVLFLLE